MARHRKQRADRQDSPDHVRPGSERRLRASRPGYNAEGSSTDIPNRRWAILQARQQETEVNLRESIRPQDLNRFDPSECPARPRYRKSPRNGGWTFVEMLVAMALSPPICLGAGALALQSISANAKRATSIVEIDIGEATNQNFYGTATGKIRTYMAPNFGKLMHAQELREKNGGGLLFAPPPSFAWPVPFPTTVRPDKLTFPGRNRQSGPRLDTPEEFRSISRGSGTDLRRPSSPPRSATCLPPHFPTPRSSFSDPSNDIERDQGSMQSMRSTSSPLRTGPGPTHRSVATWMIP